MGFHSIVPILLSAGANPDAKAGCGATPMMMTTVKFSSRKTADFLMSYGANLDCQNFFGETVLILCANKGGKGRMLAIDLIAGGAKLTVRDSSLETVLHHAARNGDVVLLKFILRYANTELYGMKNRVCVCVCATIPLVEAFFFFSMIFVSARATISRFLFALGLHPCCGARVALKRRF